MREIFLGTEIYRYSPYLYIFPFYIFILESVSTTIAFQELGHAWRFKILERITTNNHLQYDNNLRKKTKKLRKATWFEWSPHPTL